MAVVSQEAKNYYKIETAVPVDTSESLTCSSNHLSLEPPALERSCRAFRAVVDCCLDHTLALVDRKRRSNAKVVARGEEDLVGPQRRLVASSLCLRDLVCPASVRRHVTIAPAHNVGQRSGLVVAPELGSGTAGCSQRRSVTDNADTGVGVGPQVCASRADRGVPCF
jgi:hypothetical protein